MGDENQKPILGKDVCTIRVAFPVESDEQALTVKKQLSEALKDVNGVKMQFAISNVAGMIPPYGP